MATATQMIPTESQRASAACHLERRSEWTFYRVAGVRYVAMPSGRSGRVYRVRADGTGCECDAYQKWNYSACAHMLAIREAANHDAIAEWLADQADELLAEYDAQQQPATAWKPCRCGALIEPEARSQRLCSGCLERGLLRLFEHVED